MNGEASEYEVHIHADGSTMVLGYPPSDPETLYSPIPTHSNSVLEGINYHEVR